MDCDNSLAIKYYNYRQLPCIPSSLSALNYLLIFTESAALLICSSVFFVIIRSRVYCKDMRSILGENLIFAIGLKVIGEMMRSVGSLTLEKGENIEEYLQSCTYCLSLYLSYVSCTYIPYSLFFLSFCEVLDYYSTGLKKKMEAFTAYKTHIFSLIALFSWLPAFYFTLILSPGSNQFIQRVFDEETGQFHIVFGLDNGEEAKMTRMIYKYISHGLSLLTNLLYILKVFLHFQGKKHGSKAYIWGMFLFVSLETVTLLNYGILNWIQYSTITTAFYGLEITNLLFMIAVGLSPLLILTRIREFQRPREKNRPGSVAPIEKKVVFVESA